MRVLLVEPYYGGSHAAWADGYAQHSCNDVEVVSLPARFWRWRLRGSAVGLAAELSATVEASGRPDVVLVSSMTDLSVLAGLSRRVLGDVPMVSYMHENQLAYPHRAAGDLDAAMRCWTSLEAADQVVFNSCYHRDVVAEALPGLAAAMPDEVPDLDPERLLSKSTVVPVGVEIDRIAALRDRARSEGPPLIVWNHRWDDDKDPEVFVRASLRLAADGLEHRVALLGEDGWQGETRRGSAAERLGEAVVLAGRVDRDTYLSVLSSADIVVSTARHEFFGVGVVEAIAAGCVPVLPDCLSYPEIVPPAHHASVLHAEGGFRARLAEVVADVGAARRATDGLAESMERFAWPVVAAMLDDALGRAVLSAS
jgi:glycosyltransferase involved in cell wall biosynthesis